MVNNFTSTQIFSYAGKLTDEELKRLYNNAPSYSITVNISGDITCIYTITIN